MRKVSEIKEENGFRLLKTAVFEFIVKIAL